VTVKEGPFVSNTAWLIEGEDEKVLPMEEVWRRVGVRVEEKESRDRLRISHRESTPERVRVRTKCVGFGSVDGEKIPMMPLSSFG
jgi:hypothetical protein